MGPRYMVTEPVPGGYAWWNIRDTESKVMPNFSVASFSIHMPGAEHEARRICANLNAGSEPS